MIWRRKFSCILQVINMNNLLDIVLYLVWTPPHSQSYGTKIQINIQKIKQCLQSNINTLSDVKRNHLKTKFISRNSYNYCGIIEIRMGQCSWLASLLQAYGDVVSCILLYLQKEIWLFNPNLFLLEDVYSWVKGTHEFYENWTTKKSNDSTVFKTVSSILIQRNVVLL